MMCPNILNIVLFCVTSLVIFCLLLLNYGQTITEECTCKFLHQSDHLFKEIENEWMSYFSSSLQSLFTREHFS